MLTTNDFIPTKYSQIIESGNFQWSAPSNIALVKYWGKKDNQIPANPSVSFTLNNCKTITKLAFAKKPFRLRSMRQIILFRLIYFLKVNQRKISNQKFKNS